MARLSTHHRVASVLLAGLVACLAIVGATPARAEGETARSFTFDGALNADGSLTATQTLVFDEAPSSITQRLALEAPIDPQRSWRYSISDVSATVAGAEVFPRVEHHDDEVVVTLETSGADGEPITLSYTATGSTRSERGHDGEWTVMSWRVLQGLSVGAESVEGSLRVAAIPGMVDCIAGPPGAVAKCQLFGSGTHDSLQPLFEAGSRGPGEQVTFTVGVPASSVTPTAEVVESWSLDRAFTIQWWTVLAALAALLFGGALLYLLHRRTGVDEGHDGDVPAVGLFTPVAEGESVFVVPEGIRPGHVGTVADERVDPVDVTATLVDLAVRGHLRIVELPRDAHGLLDWRLERRDAATDDDLAGFEHALLAAVAPERGYTLVSELPATLAPAIGDVQSALYDDVVARGWFESRPDSTRNAWRARGWVGLAVLSVTALALVAFTRLGLVALVLVLLGGVLVWIADRMPRRTAHGTRLVEGLSALSSLLETHPTDQMPRDRRLAELARVLPYTVVLGGKSRWLAAMAEADRDKTPDPRAVDWYHAPESWHLADLPASMTQFIHTVQGELAGR